MSEQVDDFMKKYSVQEELKQAVAKRLQDNQKKEIEEKKQFEIDLQTLFRKKLRPKLNEIKSKMVDFKFEIDPEFKQIQSTLFSFNINVLKTGYPKLIITIHGNTNNKKITLFTKNSLHQKGMTEFEFSFDEFNAGSFEMGFMKILTSFYLNKQPAQNKGSSAIAGEVGSFDCNVKNTQNDYKKIDNKS